MLFVTIRRLSFKNVNPNNLPEYGGAPQEVVLRKMLEELEKEIQEAVATIAQPEITPDEIIVSIPEEQERAGIWWLNPVVEIDFSDMQLCTPLIKRAALGVVCRVVWKKYPMGYLDSVRGYFNTTGPQQYLKITAENMA